jgi:NAD(P)-dependent dehydrogenase (short-subunit alcohol dehydrogenase family)
VALKEVASMFGKGKVAVITGIGPGMGRSIALAFAREGVDVAIGARRMERVNAVAEEIRALGRDVVAQPADLTDPVSMHALVAAAAERFGGVDFLVQNGHDEGDWGPAVEADVGMWRRVFDVNLFGALELVQSCVPQMLKRGGGAIVFVSSGASIQAPPGMGAYAASKAALASLTRSLALELGSKAIRVNEVVLGATAGETLDGASKKAAAMIGITPEEWMQRKPQEYALRSIPEPEDCAGSVLYLCSDLARPVTGVHVPVNGGQWVL